MPKRDIKLYIEDINLSCNKILKYTKDLDEKAFKKDEMVIDAVVRNLEIIGEAAKHIPVSVRKQYKVIPWTHIRAMRNKITHEYFGVDKRILWKTIEEDIKKLKKEIFKIKKDLKSNTLF